MTFAEYKQQLTEAFIKSGACNDGMKGLADCNNVQSTWQLMRANWNWVVDSGMSDFCNFFREHIAEWYDSFRKEMNEAYIFYNETADHGWLFADDKAKGCITAAIRCERVFILAPSNVAAYGNVGVYCPGDCGELELFDHAYADVGSGKVKVNDYSSVTMNNGGTVLTHDWGKVTLNKGTCFDFGHKRILAVGKGSTVFTQNKRYVKAENGAKILPNDKEEDKL